MFFEQYVFSVADELLLGGMGKYSCPWAVPSHPHGQEYLPMPPRRDRTLNTYLNMGDTNSPLAKTPFVTTDSYA